MDSTMRIEGYRLISRCFSYPDDELLGALAAGTLGVGVRSACDDAGLLATYAGRRPEEFATRLRSVYTRLFIGTPRPACLPYESSQRSALKGQHADLFVNPCAQAVLETYRTGGVNLSPDNVEPPDHVVSEAEFAALLLHAQVAGQPLPVSHDAFYDAHIGLWFYLFARNVRACTDEPLYQWAADLVDVVAPRSAGADGAEELARLEMQAAREHEANDALLRDRLMRDVADGAVHQPDLPSGSTSVPIR